MRQRPEGEEGLDPAVEFRQSASGDNEGHRLTPLPGLSAWGLLHVHKTAGSPHKHFLHPLRCHVICWTSVNMSALCPYQETLPGAQYFEETANPASGEGGCFCPSSQLQLCWEGLAQTRTSLLFADVFVVPAGLASNPVYSGFSFLPCLVQFLNTLLLIHPLL